MPIELLASSIPPSRTWSEEILGSGKTRVAVLTCFIAAGIIASLGYLDYVSASYSKVAGVSFIVVGLILPHYMRWIELNRPTVQMDDKTIDDLPPELLTQILEWLSPDDRLRASAACKQWNLLAGGPFSLKRVDSAERITTFEIHRLRASDNFHGSRKLVCERLIYALKLRALEIARERTSEREESFLLCRAISQIHSTDAALAEAAKRLHQSDHIWLCFAFAKQAVRQGDTDAAYALVREAQKVIQPFSWTYKSSDLYKQEFLREIAYVHMEIGHKNEAIRAIKTAMGHDYFGYMPAIDSRAVDSLITRLIPVDFRMGPMHRILCRDLENLRSDQQIQLVGPPPYTHVDPQDVLASQPEVARNLEEGRFYKAMQRALASHNSKLLLAIVSSPYQQLHPEDPWYQDLFPANGEN